MEDNNESYYDILEVSKDATAVEIRKKKKQLSLKNHPDKLPPAKREWGEDRIKKINEAFEVLNDPEKRKIYDEFGKDGLKEKNHGPPGFNPADFFPQMFARKQQQKNKPLQIHIDMTLEEIYTGKDYTKEIDRLSQCGDCNCTGFQDKKKHNCPSCQGKGMKIEIRQIGPGMMQQSQQVCFECYGSGNDKKASNKCKKCNGNGVFEESYTINFHMDAGCHKGDHIIIKGEGNASPEFNKRGDIVIVVNEISHDIYKRGVVFKGTMNPANLLMEIEIELHESLCGFVRHFKYVSGEELYIDHNEYVKDGELKVMIGKGLPYKGKPYKFGELFIKFKVKYPETLDNDVQLKKKLYEALTGTTYDAKKIHKLPKNITPVDLNEMCDYETLQQLNEMHNNPEFDNDNDQDEDGNVQCAQQ
ncbi:DnaJ domain protein [Klosneuvirus KNV1]|uniref:DnaJ domain protein n=1 Tax=Klosneuvirus KNV1 TaxID=1977640 RepID=A0A1V0SJB4_9VIRU|nr:DnaJ domain protein [Klosneuvirus KNV1]